MICLSQAASICMCARQEPVAPRLRPGLQHARNEAIQYSRCCAAVQQCVCESGLLDLDVYEWRAGADAGELLHAVRAKTVLREVS